MTRLSHLAVAAATLAFISLSSPQSALAVSNVFNAHLSGTNVVPPTQSHATAEAKFTLSSDGTHLEYRINVGNIENVTAATLHLGAPGQNGEAVAVLYGPMPPGGGKKTGALTAGTITMATLTGSLTGRPLSDLVEAMRAGNVYIDIATDSEAGAAGRQPGNFPDGEIRGQVR